MRRFAGLVDLHFGSLKDRRQAEKVAHPLVSVIAIALLASICGCDGYDQFEAFANVRYDWLRRFLSLPSRPPSDDTFRRVFSALAPREFSDCLLEWLHALVETVGGKTIAIDGKTLRRTFDRASERSPLHLVHAWLVEGGVLIGQEATDSKSNEITAVAHLLRRLEVRGAVVTMDAMGCQKAHTHQIIDGRGDYILTVKDNQPTLHAAIETAFHAPGRKNVTRGVETFEHNHGRVEHRSYEVMPVPESITASGEWKGLQSIVRVERTRAADQGEALDVHYYITSLSVRRIKRIAHSIRAHWGVENTLHWSLDVTFAEDQSRVRTANAVENLATIRRLTLCLLKNDKSQKTSLRIKRMIAAMDPDYALHVLLSAFSAEAQENS